MQRGFTFTLDTNRRPIWREQAIAQARFSFAFLRTMSEMAMFRQLGGYFATQGFHG
jgi:hypothetical protein